MDGDAAPGVESFGGVAGNNKKTENMAIPRRRLADISNVPQQPKPAKLDAKKQSILFDTEHYIDKLQKENKALIKVLADRNKIIELSGIELQKLRINLQKFQQQNLQLAKTNTQILAELNSGKDRLKALQHELGCKNGLLNARKLEMEKAEVVTRQTSESKVETFKCNKACDSSRADNGDGKPCGARKSRPSKVQSVLGNCNIRPVEAKDKVDNKRRSSRRQSARFKSEGEPLEDVFEVDGTKFPVSTLGNDSVVETGPASVSMSDKDEPDPTVKPDEAKDRVDNKRRSSRRQSARFKSEGERSEDVFEVDGTKFPVSTLGNDSVAETGPASVSMSDKDETDPTVKPNEVKDKVDDKRRSSRRQSARLKSKVSISDKDEPDAKGISPESEAQDFGRSSIERPSCQAAKKVHSCKETSLKIKDKVDNERGYSRRQSARLKSKGEPSEDMFEIDDTKFPVSTLDDDLVLESGPTSESVAAKDEHNADHSSAEGEAPEFQRPSIGRPSRQAAKKVHSYKEISRKVKMRRTA